MNAGNLPPKTSISILVLAVVIAFRLAAPAQEGPKYGAPDPLAISREDRLKVFTKLWQIVSREYFDPQFKGIDWTQIKERYRPQVEASKNKTQLRDVLQKMLNELHSSHLTVNVRAKIEEKRITQDLSRPVRNRERFLFDTGIHPIRIEGSLVVDSVSDGSGAQLSGLRRGWVLTHWNGVPLGIDLFTCDLGETVYLRLIDLQGQEKLMNVVCKLYPTPQHLPERIVRVLAGGAVYF